MSLEAPTPAPSLTDLPTSHAAFRDAFIPAKSRHAVADTRSPNRGAVRGERLLASDAGAPRSGAHGISGSADLATRGNQDEFQRAQRVAGGHLIPGDVEWLTKGLAAFLASGGSVSLERCLHLPRNDAALRRASRNYWLRRAWSLQGDRSSPWRCSELLAAAVRDFSARQWPRWRTLAEAPRHVSELQCVLFHAFRSHERIPSTAMQLHNIARHCDEPLPAPALPTQAGNVSDRRVDVSRRVTTHSSIP